MFTQRSDLASQIASGETGGEISLKIKMEIFVKNQEQNAAGAIIKAGIRVYDWLYKDVEMKNLGYYNKAEESGIVRNEFKDLYEMQSTFERIYQKNVKKPQNKIKTELLNLFKQTFPEAKTADREFKGTLSFESIFDAIQTLDSVLFVALSEKFPRMKEPQPAEEQTCSCTIL